MPAITIDYCASRQLHAVAPVPTRCTAPSIGYWRLQLAAHLLEREKLSISQAAAEVGYESEAAFNRAFKKQVGVPPGAWRRARSVPPKRAALQLTAAD
jgi:hypothetical protein